MNLNQKTSSTQSADILPSFKKQHLIGFIGVCICLFLLLTATTTVYSAQPSETTTEQSAVKIAVGHIQFVIGRHVQIQRHQKTIQAAIGTPLYQNDALITGKNSFIHVKMVDDALISIRPQSHLQINCYQGTAEQGEACLKFTLLKGQVRKVSGKIGKESPTQYRLNTPVAAIGIRGTDYIASVQGGMSLVKVMQGAISVTPFVEGCTAQGFGECHTSLTALLTEHDAYMLRILSEQMPQLVTADLQTYSQAQAMTDNKDSVNEENAKTEESEENTRETEPSQNIQQPLEADTVANEQHAPSESLMSVEAPILKDNEDLIAQFIQQANQDLEQGLAEGDLKELRLPQLIVKQPADLVFGTWGTYADGIALPYSEAKEGRTITVGDSQSALWRSEGAYQPPQGKIDYDLSQSNAYVKSGDQLISAEVTSGSMNIDFDQKLLSTKMTIEPGNMRKVIYTASHNLTRSDGIFANNTVTGRVGEGAISNDGSQVGYRLQQPVERGTLYADTLWDAVKSP